MLYACDRQWWLQYHDHAHARCSGEFWTTNESAASVFNLNFIESEPGGGLSSRDGYIRQGGNSGFQAVGLALLFGARRIILLGFDMQYSQRRSHWHGDHHGDLHNPEPARFDAWMDHFAALGAQSGAQIINCTRDSALTCFPKADLIESLA